MKAFLLINNYFNYLASSIFTTSTSNIKTELAGIAGDGL
jgi:hypothetical protein